MARCKYPDSVCTNMTLLHGMAYCDSVPCSLRDELPKSTNADRVRAMSDEDLAEWILMEIPKIVEEPIWCDSHCEDSCDHERECVKIWLQQPAPEEGEQNV